MTRRPATLLLVVALLALAVLGLARSAGVGGPPSDAERAAAISRSLRCPTCQGLSVADSSSPLAKSMRRIVDERVAAGQSAEEVRAYFTDRYGAWVLLSPPARGSGWLVWLVPVTVLLLGLVVASGRLRGRADGRTDGRTDGRSDGREGGRWSRRLGSQPVRWAAVSTALALAVGVLMATTLDKRGAGEQVTGTVPAAAGTDSTSPPGAAASDQTDQRDGADAARLDELRAAVKRTPKDPRPRLALASTAFELGRWDVVRVQARAVLDRQPRNVDALLLRGLAPSSPDDAAARASLRRFVRLAPPRHPGIALAEKILDGGR